MKYIYSLLLLMLLAQLKLQAQEQEMEKYIPSPQTWDFMAYGNVSVGYYTGMLDMQIPIYHYKDKDFDIPISIGYNSAGFVPSKPAGSMGLSWFLNCGGVITRKIMGVPDDKMGLHSHNAAQYLDGFMVGKMNDPNVANNEQLFNIEAGDQNARHEWYMGSASLEYETSPDIFSFNFLGYSGKFMMGHDGEIYVWDCVGSGSIEIDLEGVPHQPYYQSVPKNSEIRIITGNGYTYVFGGSRHNLEYYYPSGSATSDGVGIVDAPTIVAWYLSKIIAPNGRVVNFEYDSSDPTPSSFEWYHTDSFKGDCYVANITPSSYREAVYSYLAMPYPIGKNWYWASVANEEPAYQLMRTAFLKSLAFDTGDSIKLTYGKKEKVDIHDDPNKYYIPTALRLDKISVIENQGQIVKEALFTTSYKGLLGRERLFLDKITIVGEGDYTFEYALRVNNENLPSTTTRTVDYWGFWKGGNNNLSYNMFPGITFDSNNNFIYTNNTRATNPLYAEASLLKKITYPTSGYTMVEYESHNYSSRLERKHDNSFMPKLYDVIGYAGGARVKSIIDNDGAIGSRRRTFEYTYKRNGVEASSGIAMSWIRTVTLLSGMLNLPGFEFEIQGVRMSASGFSISCTDAEHVTYKEVTERFSDGSYIVHENSHYDANRADDVVQNRAAVGGFPDSVIEPLDFWINFFRQPNDRSSERGKHLSSKYYNSDNILVSKDTTLYARIYNGHIVSKEPFITSISSSGNKFYSYKNYIYSYLPVEARKTIYDKAGDNPVTSVSAIKYNSLGLESRRTESRSDGGLLISYTRYPGDIGPIYGEPSQEEAKAVKIMQSSMRAVPMEQVTKLKLPNVNTEQFLFAKLYTYALTNNIPLPKAVLALNSSAENTSYTPVHLGSGSLVWDGKLEQEISCDLYDSGGNLLQSTGRDGIPISYLWGYNGAYPVLKVIGDTYHNVSGYLSSIEKSCIQNRAYTSSELHQVLSNVRTKYINQKKTVHASSYSYIPLIGLYTEVGPDNRATHYRYDKFGRLRRILDDDMNVVKQYRYHYANQADDGYEDMDEPKPYQDPIWKPTGVEICELVNSRTTGFITQEYENVNPNLTPADTTMWLRDSTRFGSQHCAVDYWWVQQDETVHIYRSYLEDGSDPNIRFSFKIKVTTPNGSEVGRYDYDAYLHNRLSGEKVIQDYYEYPGYNITIIEWCWIDGNGVRFLCSPATSEPEPERDRTPYWRSTGEYECLKDSNNRNTGYANVKERDENPYSPTYNTYRYQVYESLRSCSVDSGLASYWYMLENPDTDPIIYIYRSFNDDRTAIFHIEVAFELSNGYIEKEWYDCYFYDSSGTAAAFVAQLFQREGAVRSWLTSSCWIEFK